VVVDVCAICDAMGQRVEDDGSITITGEAKSDAEVIRVMLDAGAVLEDWSPNKSVRRRQRRKVNRQG
jgi:hypothetical protein